MLYFVWIILFFNLKMCYGLFTSKFRQIADFFFKMWPLKDTREYSVHFLEKANYKLITLQFIVLKHVVLFYIN